MYIKLKPAVVKPSWINQEKLMHVKGYSATLKTDVTGLIPIKKKTFIKTIKSAAKHKTELVVEWKPSTQLKDQHFINPAK